MADGQNSAECRWGGIGVELGDKKREVESIAGASDRFNAHKLPQNAALLGYRYFHESTLAPEEPISRAIASTLTRTGIDARGVDMLIVASADVDYLAARKLVPELLHLCGLSSALPMTVTSQECTSMLSAIDLARRYVLAGSCRNILVVSYDRARSEAQRIQAFGVVSDAAIACMVSSQYPLDFRIKGFSHKSDLQGMRGGDDFASRKSLIHSVTADVLTQGQVSLADVKKVFATNFFKPLAKFNASTLGLDEAQLHTHNSAEIGHCLCGDPLINLAAYLQEDPSRLGGELYMLQAYAPGFLASMLVSHVARPSAVDGAGVSADMVEESW